MFSTEITLKDQRVIRVFISSTFRDMQEERDILIKKVFPQLRKMCEERAVSWTEVDLRWGITTEEASEGKVLPLCLAEIQRCRPYFIGLLGERYGWIPEEKDIPDDLLEIQPWLKEHRDYSVTELEVLHGVLRDPAMADRSVFYFRDPAFLEHLPAGANSADFAAESPAAAVKLVDLKNRIRAEYAAGRLLYPPRESYPDPEALGAMVLADFTEIIEQLYPKTAIPDPLDQEAMLHEAYAQNRRLAFIGREDLLIKMDEHMMAADAMPLILTGESGCGKSALLAEWAARWRKKCPEDLVIEHYIGSSQESADWQGLVRRILGELKRAFDIADELPIQTEALRTALQDWLTRTAGNRRIILLLDALNQLSNDDPAARQLGWLPFAFPANIRLIVSSLSGESLESVRRRNWPEMNVPLFSRPDITPAAEKYFSIFGKKPPREILAIMEVAPAATNALYLRAVLDELRQFGMHEELEARAAYYLAAPDLPDLFDRILKRWHDDFGQEKKHPDLVRRSLCLIACSRFGLSESELRDLLVTENEPLPRRYWTTFYLSIENAMAQRSGLLTFGHDYLRSAIQRRWLMDDTTALSFRELLADYFSNILNPTDRKLDELPALLRDTSQLEHLKGLLADMPSFLRMREKERWKWELHGYWMTLEGHFDPVEVYLQAISTIESKSTPKQMAFICSRIASFHEDAGRYAGAEALFRRAVEIGEHDLGNYHPDTLTNVFNLAGLLESKGDYTGAEPLYIRALKARELVLGPDHPDTLLTVNNLAVLFMSKGDYISTEPLFRRALETGERVMGTEHPDTLKCVNNLATLFMEKGDYISAEPLFRRALETGERVMGAEHPNTLTIMNNLSQLLYLKGNYADAESLCRRALEGREKVLGKDHPHTLVSINNLAKLLHGKGDYAGAEQFYRRSLSIQEKALGTEHRETLNSMNNLASFLHDTGDIANAEHLYRHALEVGERVLGREHPVALLSVSGLAKLLKDRGDYGGAEVLYRNVLNVRKRVLGDEHPETLISMSNLATVLQVKGDSTGAEQSYRHVLKSQESILGKEHPETIITVSNLASVLHSKGDFAGAEPLSIRALNTRVV